MNQSLLENLVLQVLKILLKISYFIQKSKTFVKR